jgi:hypothetical protein
MRNIKKGKSKAGPLQNPVKIDKNNGKKAKQFTFTPGLNKW